MSDRTAVSIRAVILVAMLGCETSLVAPDREVVSQSPLAARGTEVPGSYQLEFLDNARNVVTSLPILTELVLWAHVEDLAGNDAQGGAVTFEYCSLNGLPDNDITRADEAPMAACADRSASWQRLLTLTVNSSGDALMNFGFVRIPRTVGFRIKYSARKSGIQSGVSLPRDFTWTALS